MFVHQSQLRHLLAPQKYSSEEFHQREKDRLFINSWQCVALASELPHNGDFLTRNLLGIPLLLYRQEGDYRAFLNVCPHRHSMLSDRPCGSMTKLKCQYHGWEFDLCGRTGRIPDARCFRPFDRENAHLRVFPLKQCGDLLFVCLGDQPPDFREALHPFYEFLAETFVPPWQFAQVWEYELSANWKIPVENSLESYHIPEVHPQTFGNFPPEEHVSHELDDRYTTFRQVVPEGFFARLQRRFVKRLGAVSTDVYTHRHLHPNLVMTSSDLIRMVQVFWPTSPTTTRMRVWLSVFRGTRRNPYARFLARGVRRFAIRSSYRILMEDRGILEGIQQGMQCSPHPGVIGTREERVYVFQKYVADRCGPLDSPPPSSENGEQNGSALRAAASE